MHWEIDEGNSPPNVIQGYCHPQMWNDGVTIGYEQLAYFYKHQITCIMSATFPFPLQRTLQYTQSTNLPSIKCRSAPSGQHHRATKLNRLESLTEFVCQDRAPKN